MRPRRNLGRAYPQLTIAERFRLLIAAQARGDSAEVERLFGSCPVRNYRLRDPALNDLYERAWALTAGMVLDLVALKGRLDVLEGSGKVARMCLVLAEDDAAFEAYKATGEEQPAVSEAVLRQRRRLRVALRRATRTLRVEGASLVHAYAAVCRDELEIDLDQLVAAIAAPYLELYERFCAITPDGEQVDVLRAAIAALCSRSRTSPTGMQT